MIRAILTGTTRPVAADPGSCETKPIPLGNTRPGPRTGREPGAERTQC